MTPYHASKTELPLGTVLESRFVKYGFQWDAVASALDEEAHAPILKSLLLADAFIGKGKSVLPFTVKETVLERIRANEFGDRPSRLKSIFLCPSKVDLTRFQEGVKDRPHAYLCTVDDGAVTFEADMSFVGTVQPLAPIQQQLDYLIQQGTRYWQGDKSDDPVMEVLAPPGTVKIAAQAEW